MRYAKTTNRKFRNKCAIIFLHIDEIIRFLLRKWYNHSDINDNVTVGLPVGL